MLTTYLWRSSRFSPGKGINFLSISPPHLLGNTFGSKDFVLMCRLIQCCLALYEIRVPRGENLPLTSFR
ncbi:hypothetical protein CDO51_02385 [Natranaerobius trueperi]|uniref:Uncharacterized protein n=1 Tax=Natranaerobius trueperi TaxID=759412 RepID=A0A226C000_9FIRM|nr:hypothetical protein CDO51_02385 [Natranaerobius trueperi]